MEEEEVCQQYNIKAGQVVACDRAFWITISPHRRADFNRYPRKGFSCTYFFVQAKVNTSLPYIRQSFDWFSYNVK